MRLELSTVWICLLACAVLFFVFPDSSALAQSQTNDCTTAASYREASTQTYGIVTAVINTIVGMLTQISDKFYQEIVTNSTFVAAFNGSVALVIVSYGFMVLMGAVKLAPGEIYTRVFKIGLIVWLVSPGGGWSNFNTYVSPLFWETAADLITMFTQGSMRSGLNVPSMTIGSSPGGSGTFYEMSRPVALFEEPVALLFSANFMVTVIGCFFTGPYGAFIAILLIWGARLLLRALVEALYTYIKGIVGLWFILSLAPIFLTFLFFKRTQHIFEGWLNVILSFIFQISFLFAFLGFFVVIISMSMLNFMQIQWCFVEIDTIIVGLPAKITLPRPYLIQDATGNIIPLGDGAWGLFGFLNNPNRQFPLDLIDVLFFVLSSYVAWNYSRYVPQFAATFANAGIQLSGVVADVGEYFRHKGWAPDQIAVKGISRAFKWGKKLFMSKTA